MKFSVLVNLTEEQFKEFYRFDHMDRMRKWLPIVTSAVVLFVLSIAFFCLFKVVDNAVPMAIILLIISLALVPLYFWNYKRRQERVMKKLNLNEPRFTYELYFSEEGGVLIMEASEGRTLEVQLDEIDAGYLGADVIYLYVKPTKAFVMPRESIDGDMTSLWQFITQYAPSNKLHDIRKPIKAD